MSANANRRENPLYGHRRLLGRSTMCEFPMYFLFHDVNIFLSNLLWEKAEMYKTHKSFFRKAELFLLVVHILNV